MKKVSIAVLIIVILTIYLNGIICLNDIDESFPPPVSNEVKGKIIDGASLFLKSYADSLLFLNEGEISEKGEYRFNASLGYIESALSKLESSKSYYRKVIEIVSNIEYVQYKIDKLKNYDYDTFKSENFANSEILNLVKSYLSIGDVKGIYEKNLDYIEIAGNILKKIRDQLKNGYKPLVSDCWELLRVYSQTILFGNYATTLATNAFEDE